MSLWWSEDDTKDTSVFTGSNVESRRLIMASCLNQTQADPTANEPSWNKTTLRIKTRQEQIASRIFARVSFLERRKKCWYIFPPSGDILTSSVRRNENKNASHKGLFNSNQVSFCEAASLVVMDNTAGAADCIDHHLFKLMWWTY